MDEVHERGSTGGREQMRDYRRQGVQDAGSTGGREYRREEVQEGASTGGREYRREGVQEGGRTGGREYRREGGSEMMTVAAQSQPQQLARLHEPYHVAVLGVAHPHHAT